MKGTIAVLAVLVAASPAGAVVGGEPVAPATVPWYASINGCESVLVAPDRVATAGHCVLHRSMKELEYVNVGGTLHKTVRVAMHPGWRHANGKNVLDDVAIIQMVRKADAGHQLVCGVEASNDGGTLSVPFATSAIAKIPR
jgi:hypothetical protein